MVSGDVMGLVFGFVFRSGWLLLGLGFACGGGYQYATFWLFNFGFMFLDS